MANDEPQEIITLKNATVTRLHSKGHGVDVTVTRQHGEKTYRSKYALWFKEPSGLEVGDRVDVSGFLSAKVGEPWAGHDGIMRTSVELSVNSPRIDGSPAASAPPTPEPAVSDPWPVADIPDNTWPDVETPF